MMVLRIILSPFEYIHPNTNQDKVEYIWRYSVTTRIIASVPASQVTTINSVKANTFALPTPNKLTAHGRTAPVGDAFDPTKTFYPSTLAIDDNRFLHYHVIVWTKLFGQEIPDYGCVYTNEGGLRLCFNSLKSRSKFERWFKRYQRVFFGDGSISKCYAPFLSTGKISGYFVEDDISFQMESSQSTLTVGMFANSKANSGSISETFLPDWVMIVKHSQKRVVRLNNGWLFTSANDGVMFKMMRG